MIEFRSNSTDFLKRTTRRLFYELLVLAVLVAAKALDLLTAVPVWIQWTVAILIVIYISLGLAFYPRAKAVADSLYVKLNDHGLIFAHAAGGGELRYSDIKISGVRKSGENLIEIILVARSGQTIKLQGLENMGELYRLLSERVAS